MYVTEVYEFQVLAGKGASSATSIAAEAARIAEEFFDAHAFDLLVDVSGKAGQWVLNCRAEAKIKVRDELDGY